MSARQYVASKVEIWIDGKPVSTIGLSFDAGKHAARITAKQRRIARRFQGAVDAAKALGFAVIADGDGAIRIILASELGAPDLRGLGVRVEVHGGCGAPGMESLKGSSS